MTSILRRRDSLVVLPTGGGKSLCFQAPAMVLSGIAIVISPLLSLMKDQTDALLACGIPAACLNSMQTPSERSDVLNRLKEQKLKLLYVAPERLSSPGFIDLLRKLRPSFFAIDEAHCISSWGHEFRPDYRKLTVLREMFPETGIHTFTATATPRVRDDIARQLSLRSPDVYVGSFDRPNLTYRVERRIRKWAQICSVIERHKGESGIIYCISRKNVDDLCDALCGAGYRALPYHAGMSDADRKRSQEAFVREDADIVVATVAFGMGIDKSNVRYVLHAAAPKSIENYQQEAGRAGRDGLPADCVLLWGPGDFLLWRRILGDLEPEVRRAAVKKLSHMSDYCTAAVCRHRTLVTYFGQACSGTHCAACDVCLGGPEPVDDPLTIAQKILSCVVRLGDPYPAGYTGRVLVGSDDGRILENGHDRLSTFGVLDGHSRRDVRSWIEQLRAQNCLALSPHSTGLVVTPRGWRVLRGENAPSLVRSTRKSSRRVSLKRPVETEADRSLFEALRGLRRTLADARSVPAFVVFSDAVLIEITRRRPGSLATFLNISGVGEKKCHEFGPAFVEFIVAWCRRHGLTPDAGIPAGPQSPEHSIPPVPATNAAELEAYRLFRKGMTADAVGRELTRARSTVMRYLENFLRRNGRTSPEPWVDSGTYARIRESVLRIGGDHLQPLFNDLDGQIDYDTIRIGLACLANAAGESCP